MRERRGGALSLLAVCFAVSLLGWPGPAQASSSEFTVSRLSPLTGDLTAPTAVAAGADGRVYVAESSRNRVLVFSAEGHLLRTLGGLRRPISLAVGSDDKLFVGNDETGSVDVYGPDLAPAGHLGQGRREFQHPTGIALDAAGRVYVIDGKASQVRVYGPDRALVRTFGEPGTADGQFTSPTCLALREEAGELYVVDRPPPVGRTGTQGGARVQVFSLEGAFQRRVGAFGLGDGRLARPVGVQADRAGRLYVTDAFQNLVQVFGADGAFLGSIHDPDHPLRTPLGLALDSSLRLAVASLNTGRVERFQLFRQPHTVTVVVTGSGAVSPPGPVVAEDGTDVILQFAPNPGHRLAALRVEGVGVAVSGSSYTLTALSADRLVEVVFEPAQATEVAPAHWTVTTEAGPGGTVEPGGAVEVPHGGSLALHLIPAQGYQIEDVRIDGVSVGPVSSYVLRDVRAAHSVRATFSAVPAVPGPDAGAPPPPVTPDPSAPDSGEAFGPDGRFSPTPEGTLVDLAVGLVWAAEPRCRPRLTWEKALMYAADVNRGLHPGCGPAGLVWRLPNANELLSLAWGPRRDLECPEGPCPDLAAWLEARGTAEVAPGPHWTSTSYAGEPDKAWVVEFEEGSLGTAVKSTVAAVWLAATAPGGVPLSRHTGQTTCYDAAGGEIPCPGSGQDGELQAGTPWPQPRLLDNGDGTVRSPAVGVSWLRDAGCLGEQPEGDLPEVLEALGVTPQAAGCEGLQAAGYTDWRLPTRGELYTLLDYSRPAPYLPEGHPFQGVPAAGIWVADPARSVAALGPELPRAAQRSPGEDLATVWPVRTGESAGGPDLPGDAEQTTPPTLPPPPPAAEDAGGRKGACFLQTLVWE